VTGTRPATAPICEPGDVLVASHNRAAPSLVALAPEMRTAMQRIRRYGRMAAEARSAGGRALAESKQAAASGEYAVLADQWSRLHRLLDARTAVLVARAVRAQFPDPAQRERYLR
jgi:hypothetical protein